jgi:hypothetical protein
MNSIRLVFTLSFCALFAWAGWSVYDYFLDITSPIVKLAGIESYAYYSGDIQCRVQSDKTGLLTLTVDSHDVVTNHKIKSGQEQLFTIETKSLSNGKHTIKMAFTDGTYHKNSIISEKDFYIDNQPLHATLIGSGIPCKVNQGRTLHLQCTVNKNIKHICANVFSKKYECCPEAKNSRIYECFIPIECEEQPNEYICGIDIEDHVGRTRHIDAPFQVMAFPFKKEALHVTPDKVKEEKALGKDGKDLEEALLLLSEQSPHEKLWRGQFCAPIEIQRVSCDFGTIRTTQHKGRYAHKAVDVINAPKSVVWAPQEGVVVMKERFAPSGNTVVIDHGMGILSLFYHLDSFADIELGQKIVQGNPIGTIGKTGFATGYHLHWEMRINNVPVDPLQWTTL